jgi:hypothetical protein
VVPPPPPPPLALSAGGSQQPWRRRRRRRPSRYPQGAASSPRPCAAPSPPQQQQQQQLVLSRGYPSSPTSPCITASRVSNQRTRRGGGVPAVDLPSPQTEQGQRGVWGRGSRALAPERRSLPATPPPAPLPLPGGGGAGSGSRARRAGGGGAPLVARIRGWGERALRSKDLLWQAGARAAALEVLSHSRPGSGCLLHAPNRQPQRPSQLLLLLHVSNVRP